MKNIEVKIFVNNFKEIKRLLRKMKVRHIGEMFQKDVYYNCGAQRIKIRNIDNKKFELIIYERSDKFGSKISNYQIFNIEPKQIKCTQRLMEKCFKKKVTVEKKRDLWIYKKTRIHLDKVVKLGKFLELETVNMGNLKKSQVEFNNIFNLLNLKKYKKYNHSYSDLLLEKK